MTWSLSTITKNCERFTTNKMLEDQDPTKYDPIRVQELNYTNKWMTRLAKASNEFADGEEALT